MRTARFNILPHSLPARRGKIIDHQKEEGSNDLIGYTGLIPGDPLIVGRQHRACDSVSSTASSDKTNGCVASICRE